MEAIDTSTCITCGCSGNSCKRDPRFQGWKLEWPELVGAGQMFATAVIERENPRVTVVPIAIGDPRVHVPDVCCNRIKLIVSELGGVVVKVPKVQGFIQVGPPP
ncbi:glu S.griseus protease inhibitor-like [Actinidia eriantha]|uniref:glu S.griseus protease inhibitor-like n=1 Tax=Actinidia eriantha TaxID=165200 RepID=UPI00258DD3C2|nr:glu S.griseus protease inhibitor-like [Actinidia eriantha]